MTEAEFWEWVENDPREVGAALLALLVTLDALRMGVDAVNPHEDGLAITCWQPNARKVLDAFGAE